MFYYIFLKLVFYYTQYFVITYKGKESENTYTHTHITESLCCTPETNTTL